MTKKELITLLCDTFYQENKNILDNPSLRINMFDVANGVIEIVSKLQEKDLLKDLEKEKYLDEEE